MRHVSWVGIVALLYVALQARAVLAQPRSGVVRSLIEILVSLLPLFIVGYAAIDWLRGRNDLNVIPGHRHGAGDHGDADRCHHLHVVSLRLNKLSVQGVEIHPHRS
jgi:hypothetical protein